MPSTSTSNLLFRANNAAINNGSFSGTAYSGEVIENHGYWGNVIFDLDSMEAPEQIPVLLEHSRRQRAGFVESSSISNDSGLSVSGKFLDPEKNQYSKEIQDDAGGQFPWQMSVYIIPANIDRVETSMMVNGKMREASQNEPLTIFRNSHIREVSFVAIGADRYTGVSTFNDEQSDSFKFEFSNEVNVMPDGTKGAGDAGNNAGDNSALALQFSELQQQFAEMKQQNEADKAENAALKGQIAAIEKQKRTDEITSLFSDIGRQPTEEESTQFHAMSADLFAFMAGQMRNTHQKAVQEAGLSGDYQFNDANQQQGQKPSLDTLFGIEENANKGII